MSQYLKRAFVFEKEHVSDKDKLTYQVMLNLRTIEGLDISFVKNKEKEINELVSSGLLTIKDNHLIPTYEGMMVLDQIILEIIHQLIIGFYHHLYYKEEDRMVNSIRMIEEGKQLADAYAKLNGISLSEAIKRAYFEKQKKNMTSLQRIPPYVNTKRILKLILMKKTRKCLGYEISNRVFTIGF